ncbi:MAG: hybrid sensor histidine kinase/response regulator [Candidatus Parabeggiatoa sp. nov. 1]|nr:MAG: hybrid sensor histidine kinase/response regulator [Gammaproteobacteria bacterium]
MPIIICVDDEKSILNSLQMELVSALGDEYLIETAEGGFEALELFEKLLEDNYEIPLIISDCMMPDMPGDELLKYIHTISPKTFKIMLADQTNTDAIVNALNHADLYRYIPKPWDSGELILTVYEAIKSYFKDQLLEEQNEALKEMNTTLQERSETLVQTLDNLKATQQELIHSEKMITLGQLIAGVAHELNTPLAAIRSSVENILNFLKALEQLPPFFQMLCSEHQQDFFALLKKSIQQTPLSSKEKRQLRRTLVRQLNEHAIEDATTVADTLVDMGIYEIEAFLPLLTDSKSETILEKAYQLAGLQKSAQTITFASERAAKVVFALKSFARYDQTGKKTPSNLIEGIETVLTLYHNQLKGGVELIKNYTELPQVMCYPDELNQVWTNLVHNALQAMSNKGTLQIDVALQDNQILISFTDSGPGIPDEIKSKIFEPFFTTKPAGEGSGLGLDIVKKIIEKHNGRIKVDSIPGKTTFTVSIPVNPNEETCHV